MRACVPHQLDALLVPELVRLLAPVPRDIYDQLRCVCNAPQLSEVLLCEPVELELGPVRRPRLSVISPRKPLSSARH